MFEFKLQVGAMAIALYISISYIKDTMRTREDCNKYFDFLLLICPFAIFFDGLTAWTVNHMDLVSDFWNRAFHGAFFISMNLATMAIFVYMVDQTIGIERKRDLLVLCTPGIISIAWVLVFLDKLYFIYGKTTNYSMGVAVVGGYTSLVLHMMFILFLIITKHRTIEKRKVFSLSVIMLICISLLIVQVINPEVLLTSLLPPMCLLGIYINFEAPALVRLKRYNDDMVMSFANLVENRDDNTGGHVKRTKEYVCIILDEMKNEPKYNKVISKDYYNNVLNAAPMHDIGKIGTPDYILQKPGKLTDEEYTIMKEHTTIGGNIIKESFADIDDEEYKQIVFEVARFHHEKWDGSGYPAGVAGEKIPLHARIMAIADVFDAVSAKRCYRDALPLDVCFSIIEEGAGTSFDPDLTRLFFRAKPRIIEFYNSEEMKTKSS